MAFTKAQDLIELALMAASRRGGVCLEEIAETFGVSHRTAQRMTEADALLAALGHVARPGPRVLLAAGVMDAEIGALRGPFRLR